MVSGHVGDGRDPANVRPTEAVGRSVNHKVSSERVEEG
jgi:hypothetical protein